MAEQRSECAPPPQIPKPVMLKGVGMSPAAGGTPGNGGGGYSRGGSVEYEGPSGGYGAGAGSGMPEGGSSQYMGGERPSRAELLPLRMYIFPLLIRSE